MIGMIVAVQNIVLSGGERCWRQWRSEDQHRRGQSRVPTRRNRGRGRWRSRWRWCRRGCRGCEPAGRQAPGQTRAAGSSTPATFTFASYLHSFVDIWAPLQRVDVLWVVGGKVLWVWWVNLSHAPYCSSSKMQNKYSLLGLVGHEVQVK